MIRIAPLTILLLTLSCGKEFTKTSKNIATNSDPVEILETPTPIEQEKDNAQDSDGQTGVDLMGKTRNCVDQRAVMSCSSVFTASDEFANNCRAQGNTAVMCACHDWICVQ